MTPAIPTETTATEAPRAVTVTVTTGRPSHRRDTSPPQPSRQTSIPICPRIPLSIPGAHAAASRPAPTLAPLTAPRGAVGALK